MNSQIKNAKDRLIRQQNEKLNLDKQLLAENQKINRINDDIARINRSMTGNISMSQLNSKLSQINSKQKQGHQYEERTLSIQGSINRKEQEINRTKSDIARLEKQENEKLQREAKKQERSQLEFQRRLQREIENTKFKASQISLPEQQEVSNPILAQIENKSYDFFISHASEDKEDFVAPLANHLVDLGLNIWYDEFQLKIGDGLRRSIDKGLANSKFGIVVLSSSFFQKNWTQYELDGLVTKEMEGEKVILPIWHKVTKNEVKNASPSLADKVALNTSLYSIEEIAQELKELLNE